MPAWDPAVVTGTPPRSGLIQGLGRQNSTIRLLGKTMLQQYIPEKGLFNGFCKYFYRLSYISYLRLLKEFNFLRSIVVDEQLMHKSINKFQDLQ